MIVENCITGQLTEVVLYIVAKDSNELSASAGLAQRKLLQTSCGTVVDMIKCRLIGNLYSG
jgi:hypothetical protein